MTLAQKFRKPKKETNLFAFVRKFLIKDNFDNFDKLTLF